MMGQRLDYRLNFDTTYYPVAAFSCALFLFIYRYVSPRLSSKICPKYSLLTDMEQVDWNNRVCSTIHSVFISCLCAYTLAYDDEIAEEPIWWDSPVVRTSCAIVAGYMASDVIVLTVHYKHIGEACFILHHGVSIYAYYYVMTYGVLPYFANYRLVAEFSTPFVNQRWFLAQLGYEKTSAVFMANGLAMAFTFFLVRIASMPSYWNRVYSVYNTPAFNQLGYIQLCLIVPCLVLDMMNIFWFHKICIGAYKVCSLFFLQERKDEKSATGAKFFNAPLNNGFTGRTLVSNELESHKHID